MKKIVWALCLILPILGACKCSSEKNKLPGEEISKNISEFATLPACVEMYRALDAMPNASLDAALSGKSIPAVSDSSMRALQTGMWFADAILAAKASNRAVLNDFQKAMELSAHGNDPGNRDRVSQLKDIIGENDKDMTTKALIHLMGNFEMELWQQGDHASYTMMVLGSWAQTASRLAPLVKARYPESAAAILGHKQGWDSIKANLQLLAGQPVAQTPLYKAALALCTQMGTLLPAGGQGTMSAAQIDTLISATDSFLAAVK